MKRTILLLMVSLVTGCSSLHIREDDGIAAKILKGTARVPVAIITFGRSEMWHKQERAMESWLGRHKSELLVAWGAPAYTASDGRGGEILTYRDAVGSGGRHKTFHAEAGGTIDSYSWEGI